MCQLDNSSSLSTLCVLHKYFTKRLFQKELSNSLAESSGCLRFFASSSINQWRSTKKVFGEVSNMGQLAATTTNKAMNAPYFLLEYHVLCGMPIYEEPLEPLDGSEWVSKYSNDKINYFGSFGRQILKLN